jgi:hypothetical protein
VSEIAIRSLVEGVELLCIAGVTGVVDRIPVLFIALVLRMIGLVAVSTLGASIRLGEGVPTFDAVAMAGDSCSEGCEHRLGLRIA